VTATLPGPPVIGVLALQGDVREHLAALRAAGADARPVRRPEELAGIDGLVVPGGESTTMAKLARSFDLLDPLRERVRASTRFGEPVPIVRAALGEEAGRFGAAIAAWRTVGVQESSLADWAEVP
jgi:hypothetical protein